MLKLLSSICYVHFSVLYLREKGFEVSLNESHCELWVKLEQAFIDQDPGRVKWASPVMDP